MCSGGQDDGGAADVDLPRGLPVATDGGVVQAGVVGSHLRGVVVEDAADHFLGDVSVDEAGPQRVPPLVRDQMHWAPVLVTDLAALQPPV